MKIIAILSAIIILTPFLGIPGSWETFIIVTFGFIIFLKSFYSYRMNRDTSKDFSTSSFKQNEFNNSNEEINEEIVENLPDNKEDVIKEVENSEHKEDIEEVKEETESNLFEENERE